MDATKGWSLVNSDALKCQLVQHTQVVQAEQNQHLVIIKFTYLIQHPTFVSSVGNVEDGKVSYLVVGGGGGGQCRAGGGSAGGFRRRKAARRSLFVSPIVAPDGIVLSSQTYPITVGAGGSGATEYITVLREAHQHFQQSHRPVAVAVVMVPNNRRKRWFRRRWCKFRTRAVQVINLLFLTSR